MAWTDTTPCSFCGKEIPIFRKFGNGKFCSKEHAEGFEKQQTQLAVEMLHRTHDALKAYKPAASSIEDILGLPARTPNPEPAVRQAVSEYELPEVAPPPVEQPIVQATPTWPELVAAPATAESREFDAAAPAMLAHLAGLVPKSAAERVPVPPQTRIPEKPAAPMDPSVFHFGDSLSKLQGQTAKPRKRDVFASLKRLWAQLWPRSASQRA